MSIPHHVLRRSLVPLALVAALCATGCGGSPDQELEFLDQVRNAYPELSVQQASDELLLELGAATCSPSALSPAQVSELRRLGVDRTRFDSLAMPLCPTR